MQYQIQWEKTRCITNLFFFLVFTKKKCYNSFFQTWCIWLGMLYPKFLFTFSVILLIYSIWKWCMMLSRILYAFLKSRLVLNMLRKKNHCSYFFLPPALFPHYKYSYIPSSMYLHAYLFMKNDLRKNLYTKHSIYLEKFLNSKRKILQK